MGIPGPGAWPRILAGTRAHGLAPLDLLLVAALVATAAQGTWARLRAGDGTCQGGIEQPMTPYVSFHDGTEVSTFQYANLALPLGVPIDEIAASDQPSAYFPLDDGALHPSDRLLRMDRWGTIWGRDASLRVRGTGAWLATGWTFLVLHDNRQYTYHLTIRC